MNPGGRGQPDAASAAALDAYLDGQLSDSARAAFEARLAKDSALAAGVSIQRRIDGRLHGLFPIPPFVPLPTNGHPTTPPHADSTVTSTIARFATRRIILGSLITLAVATGAWFSYSAFAERSNTFQSVYRQHAKAGFPPSHCPTDGLFESVSGASLGNSLRLKTVPRNVQVISVGGARVLSFNTVTLQAKVDGQPVIVFADRASNDTPEAQGQVGTSRRGLHLFRRQVSNYVLYELTPHGQPRLLDLCELTVTPARS